MATTLNDRSKEVKEFDESKIGVKGLSDSGITSIPQIFIHPPETLSTLKSSSGSVGIPVIDLSNIGSSTRRPKIVEQIREAASTWGFFQVINHGLSMSDLDGITSTIKSFHELPQEIKTKYYVRQERKGVSYTSNNDLYRAKAASWHDYIQVWMAPEALDVNEIPSVYREQILAWDRNAKGFGETLGELLSEGLGLEPSRLKDLALLESRVSVGVCYPYCPQPELTVGLSDHTDPGVLTVLLPNHVPGLQVKHDDQWVDVKPIPGALIVNIGDFLQMVTNDEYKSVQHRVLANSLKEPRISVVEFFSVFDATESLLYGPLPELLSPEKPALYRSFTTKEMNENFFGKELDSKSLIKKLRL